MMWKLSMSWRHQDANFVFTAYRDDIIEYWLCGESTGDQWTQRSQ